jgi:YVTN family beta-propeller protein
MKLTSVRIALIAVVSLFTFQLLAQNASNPIQVALLRWYPANMAAQLSTCSIPNGLAFDGSHIWVACESADEIEEFNSSDGALVRIVTGVTSPYALAYDGANIWAANYSSNSVTEVNASTGAISGPFSVGSEPSGIAFDGTNIWVTNQGSNSISKIVAATGAVTPPYPLTGCPTPWGIAFDGANLWVACHNANVVAKINPSTGSVSTTVPVGQEPISVTFDGETGQTSGPFIWTANSSSGNVSKISTTTLGVAPFAAGPQPYGMAFDGLYIWVTSPSAGTVTKLLQSTGATVGTYSTGGSGPVFVGFDGGNVYVSNRGSATIAKM